MRTHASAGLCFDCGQQLISRNVHCPRCGLPVGGAEAARLTALLIEADRVMAGLDAQRVRQPVTSAVSGNQIAAFRPAMKR